MEEAFFSSLSMAKIDTLLMGHMVKKPYPFWEALTDIAAIKECSLPPGHRQSIATNKNQQNLIRHRCTPIQEGLLHNGIMRGAPLT